DVNGITKELDYWPVLVAVNRELNQEELLVPLAFVIQQFGGLAQWHPETREIMVSSYVTVSFKDKNLESAVREQIKVQKGDIFKSDVNSVEMLIIPGRSISSLDGLEYFENLTYLDISNNFVTDLAPLRKLNKITSLFMNGNSISDDSPVSAVFKNLKRRDFELTPRFYDSSLEAEVRNATGKKAGELSLNDLSKITKLKLEEKKISNLHGMQYLFNLKELDLSNNDIETIEPLENLLKLEKLSISNNSVKNIEPLGNLMNLEYLDLDNNNVSDITPLVRCTNLKQLSLLKNNFSDEVDLYNFSNLEILDLGQNKITVINGFEDLANLRKLYLNSNNLTDINDIEKCSNLELLDLSQNYIEKTEALSKLSKLNALYLCNNNVSDTSVFSNLTNLKVLDLSGNNISRLTDSLNNLSGLSSFYLEGNSITNFSSIKPLAGNLTDKDFEVVVASNLRIIQRFYVGNSTYYVNGQKKQMDISPIIANGRTFLPVRYVSEAVGASVKWEENIQMITLALDNNTIMLWVGKDYALVNGTSVPIDAAPFIQNGRTLIPVRFVGEKLGLKIDWDSQSQEITLTK
ncbi:MAG: hypothetical protein GX660_08735, partial [Clostridiaceae bacterium]|nr:hypothetical protein [Clostridiaceae bacterium]